MLESSLALLSSAPDLHWLGLSGELQPQSLANVQQLSRLEHLEVMFVTPAVAPTQLDGLLRALPGLCTLHLSFRGAVASLAHAADVYILGS